MCKRSTRHISVEIDLGWWPEVELASSLHCKVSFLSSLSTLYFSEGSHYVQTTFKKEELCFSFLRRKYLHKLCGILLDRRSFSLFSLTCLLIQLFMYLYQCSYYSYTLAYSSVLLGLFYCSDCFGFGR